MKKHYFGVDDYDAYWQTRIKASRTEKTEIHDTIIATAERWLEPGAQVLDLGVGPGHVYQELSKKYDCYGVEVSPEVVKTYDFPTDNIAIADFSKNLPDFSGKLFDAIIASMVIHHMEDPITLLSNIRDRLKPAGVAIIVHPNIAFYPHRFRYFFRGIFPKISAAHRVLINFSDMRAMFENTGFVIRRIETVGRLAFARRLHPSLLTGAFVFICGKQH